MASNFQKYNEQQKILRDAIKAAKANGTYVPPPPPPPKSIETMTVEQATFRNPKTRKMVTYIKGPHAKKYMPPKFKRDIPTDLLSADEIKSLTGTAKTGSIAARVTPEQVLQKVSKRMYKMIFDEAINMVLNGGGYAEKQAGMRMLWDWGQGISGGKVKAGLNNQTADHIPGVTNIQIRGVEKLLPEPTESSDGADTEE